MIGKKNIYMVQFGTGANINLLPLACGQLVARLKQEKELLRKCNLCGIVFRRPRSPQELVSEMENVFIIGFSCFLWNMNISLQTAEEVRKRFPQALIVIGGPSVPKDSELTGDFFRDYPAIDVVAIGEGEEVFAAVCNRYWQNEGFADIPGIIYRDRETGTIHRTRPEEIISMDGLPSPYLDGTFDDFYRKYDSEFSGIIWETNRGCPYECTFCTWGNLPSRKIREKPMAQVKGEIEWIGRNKIKYIAMSDSNFGIRTRDVELAEMLAECKKKYGVPDFVSVSWAKHSPRKVLQISEIFKKSKIGFRITSSLQSLNDDVLKAVNRNNIKLSSYQQIKEAFRNQGLYSYTELILGLPLESYNSYLSGIEDSLSENIFDQLFIYPLFLFPNTQIASSESRRKYGLEGKIIEGRYTKSKESDNMVKEFVEIVIATLAMPRDKWVDAFVVGFYILALHDDRLAFFILRYLKKNFKIKITDLISFSREICSRGNLPILQKSFMRLENCARDVQEEGKSHLIEPEGYGDIPYDPPEGIFLELLIEREKFYSEFLYAVEMYLKKQNIIFDKAILEDLFLFQKAVIAHPDGPVAQTLHLKYDWVDYFGFAFQLEEKQLSPLQRDLKVVDRNPSNGNPERFLKHHFEVRGIPAFNEILDESGKVVFPAVALS